MPRFCLFFLEMKDSRKWFRSDTTGQALNRPAKRDIATYFLFDIASNNAEILKSAVAS
jgi:hypothetical protein